MQNIKWAKNNPEKVRASNAKWYRENRKKECIKHREYYQENKDRTLLKHKEYRKNNKPKINTYMKMKLRQNINMRLAQNLRSRIWKALKDKNVKKGDSTTKLVGISITNLRKYIGQKFQPGMSWTNYGEWHIDHKIPVSLFNLKEEKEQKKAFHYTNLQPLWAVDNIRKSNKLILNSC